MRRESSTVVVLVGEVADRLLSGLAESANVSVARGSDRRGSDTKDLTAWEAGAQALQAAARLKSTYVVVADDPLADVAASWRAMWDLSGGPAAASEFERQAGEALAAWRANRFELPDYYLVTTKVTQRSGPDLYLGPLRAVRARRVALAVTDPIGTSGIASGGLIAGAHGRGGLTESGIPTSGGPAWGEPAESAPGGSGTLSSGDEVGRVIRALRSLKHGPWWPPLDELLDAARRFYPGALTETASAARSPQ